MVAIEDSSTTEMSRITAGNVTHGQRRKYHTSPERGISGIEQRIHDAMIIAAPNISLEI